MAQSATRERQRPQLVRPRNELVPAQMQTLEAVRNITGGFDIDFWHVINERDNALIEDEILHGAMSSTFVYRFEIQKQPIIGVSVIGARHLAALHGGLEHRLVSSTRKSGRIFQFTSYPTATVPMQVTAAIVAELEEEDDYYSAVVEVKDIKTGNSIQMERQESRWEERRAGGWFERPHYATIAQSKAYRNAILALVPQDLVIRFREECLKLKKEEIVTDSVIDQKRQNVWRFAAQRALTLDRRAIEALTFDQIAGLGDAAREGLPAFAQAAKALGLEIGQDATEAAQDGEERRAASDASQNQMHNQAPTGVGRAAHSERAKPDAPDRPQTEGQPPDASGTGETDASSASSSTGTRGASRRRVDFDR
jgi:hypothetical protein